MPRVMGQARVERRMSERARLTRYQLLTVLRVADLNITLVQSVGQFSR